MNQCLFNWKNFYSKKGHRYIPGSICFPQFFSFAISTIVTHYNKSVEEIRLFMNVFLQILPTIVHHVYNDDSIKVDYEKLKKITRESDLDFDNILLLEHYLLDDESIKKYRNILLRDTLKSNYESKSLNEYVEYLIKNECCDGGGGDIITETPPSSIHYLIFYNNTDTVYKNNCSIITDVVSPMFWGPFYWNIFHTVAKNSMKNQSYKNQFIEEHLLMFIWILAGIIPCYSCSFNYMTDAESIFNCIEKYRENKNIELLYDSIHQIVSYKIYLEIKKKES